MSICTSGYGSMGMRSGAKTVCVFLWLCVLFKVGGTQAQPMASVASPAGAAQIEKSQRSVRLQAGQLLRDAQGQVTARHPARAMFLLASATVLATDGAARTKLRDVCEERLRQRDPAEDVRDARWLLRALQTQSENADTGSVEDDADEFAKRTRMLELRDQARAAYEHAAPAYAADILSVLYLLGPEARGPILYNLAQCYRQLKQYDVAYALYGRVRSETRPGGGVHAERASELAERAQRELLQTALQTPIYRRPWFLTTLVLTAAALVSVGVLAERLSPHDPPTDAGTWHGKVR